MKIIPEIKLDFSDVLIRPRRSTLKSRSEVNLCRSFVFPHSSRTLNCTPVVAANMDTTGSIQMASAISRFDCITCLHKHYDTEKLVKYFNDYQPYSFYSTGISESDISKLTTVYDRLKTKPNLCIDVANGYSEYFVETTKKIRDWYPDIIIMAGNVVTPEMTEELILHGGVDIVKVGIGSGSVCTTRLKTGIGYPQLSAIIECSDTAHALNGHICSDGGCTTPADVCKALGANADFVMLGGMLAGTDCCEGDWEYEYRRTIKDEYGKITYEWWQSFDPDNKESEKRKRALKFYGMSSKEAMHKHNGGVADYRTSEGKCVAIPYKGTTEDTIKDILGGIRSCCTYVGAKTLKDLPKNTIFIRVKDTHNRIFS